MAFMAFGAWGCFLLHGRRGLWGGFLLHGLQGLNGLWCGCSLCHGLHCLHGLWCGFLRHGHHVLHGLRCGSLLHGLHVLLGAAFFFMAFMAFVCLDAPVDLTQALGQFGALHQWETIEA